MWSKKKAGGKIRAAVFCMVENLEGASLVK